MPPVREASTKPSAATVLPAPVACSNQKRRAAPGSSAAASAAASSSASSAGSQSSGSSSGSSSPSISTSPEWQLLGRPALAVPAAAADLELGLERDQRARQGVDLVGGERRAVGEVRLLLRQQPLEAEHQRVARAATRPRARSRPASISASAASSAARRARSRRQAPGGVLSREHEGSRANSSARFSSSPETGEASARSFFQPRSAFSVMGRGRNRAARSESAGSRPSCAVAA